jgi:hypothetical protein
MILNMKTYNIYKVGILLAILFLAACDPNKELYQDLDDLQEPYNKAISDTVTSSDYNSIGGAVKTYQAFNDTAVASLYVPEILANKYPGLDLKSSAAVNYNFLELDTVRLWEKVVYGYTLTYADYQAIGGSVATYENFWEANPASNHLPNYLLTLFPSAVAEQQETIIYNFFVSNDEILPYADIYEFDGAAWVHIETISDMAEADYTLTDSDYEMIGLTVPRFPNISSADRNLPIWSKIKFPFAYSDESIILQYAYGGTTSTNIAAQYIFNGVEWIKKTGQSIVTRSEQYVFAVSGWIFDPTIRFIMSKSDYGTIATNDPIPHPRFADQGYYYGASAYYGNFDMRLLFFHLTPYEYGENVYIPEEDDPELVDIYTNEGAEAATEELFRRITQEGIIALLENKFPDAVPQAGGVDVHYVVGFETYNDNLSRSYLEAEYRCTAAADGATPPQFEFIEGPRERE